MNLSDNDLKKTSVEWLRYNVINRINIITNYMNAQKLELSNRDVNNFKFNLNSIDKIFVDNGLKYFLKDAINLSNELTPENKLSVSGAFIIVAKPINGKRVWDAYPEGRRIYFNELSVERKEAVEMKYMIMSLHKILSMLENLMLHDINSIKLDNRKPISELSNEMLTIENDLVPELELDNSLVN